MSTSTRPITQDDALSDRFVETPEHVAAWQREQLAKRHKLADQGRFVSHDEAEKIAARLLKNG